MDKLGQILKEKKKSILIGIIGFFGIIIVILLIIFLMNLFRRYDYAGIEKLMVNATTKYLSENKDLMPTDEMNKITIEYSTLVGGKYIKEMAKVSKDKSCTGYVEVYKNNNKYYYVPKLSCDNYETKTLTEKILEKENVVEKDDGLYSMNDTYTYRGEFVNNYFKFMNVTWRIIKWDEKQIYLITDDTIDNKISYVFDDRYNETTNSQRGYNSFESSRILNSLEAYYKTNFKTHEKYLVPIKACVYTRSKTDKDKTGATECNKTYETFISLLPTYDYMNASIDNLCSTIVDRNCSNYNYLSKTTNRWWLLNGTNENTYGVYSSNTIGTISVDIASNKKYLRPVISITNTLSYKTGSGTMDNPYEVYEY